MTSTNSGMFHELSAAVAADTAVTIPSTPVIATTSTSAQNKSPLQQLEQEKLIHVPRNRFLYRTSLDQLENANLQLLEETTNATDSIAATSISAQAAVDGAESSIQQQQHNRTAGETVIDNTASLQIVQTDCKETAKKTDSRRSRNIKDIGTPSTHTAGGSSEPVCDTNGGNGGLPKKRKNDTHDTSGGEVTCAGGGSSSSPIGRPTQATSTPKKDINVMYRRRRGKSMAIINKHQKRAEAKYMAHLRT